MRVEKRNGSRLRSITWLILISLVGLPQISCTPAGRRQVTLEPAQEAEVARLHAGILDAYRQGKRAEARTRSVEFLQSWPTYRDAPLLRRLLAESYLEESKWDLALHHIGKLIDDYPLSSERWAGYLIKARAMSESGQRFNAALGMDVALERWPEGIWRDRALNYQITLLNRGLSPSELTEFIRRRIRSPMAARARLSLAEHHLRESQPDLARPLLESVAADPRLGRLQQRARDLLVELGLGDEGIQITEAVSPREGLIGVMAPLSGRYKVYGEAFLDGARLALARFNSEQLSRFEMTIADTKGEAVGAALAARELIVRDGVTALLGGVLTNPTVAASVEANAHRVPTLSPSATAQNIHEVGPWVFQNNITSEAQVLALARLAVHELLASRFAVLYPNQGNGQGLAEYFNQVIYELGGEVAISIPYEVGMTDFTEPLEKIRVSQPEILFIPGEVEQLVLIVPQLAYHEIYGQVLGNEAWNSKRLARLGGERVNGAIFPSDILLKRDRKLYQEFLRLHEKRYSSSVNPIAARSFLGMTTLLEIMGDGALSREQMRDQLAIRLADMGDEVLRRELLADQVTLMTIRGGEILPFGSYEFFEPETGGEGFIDGF